MLRRFVIFYRCQCLNWNPRRRTLPLISLIHFFLIIQNTGLNLLGMLLLETERKVYLCDCEKPYRLFNRCGSYTTRVYLHRNMLPCFETSAHMCAFFLPNAVSLWGNGWDKCQIMEAEYNFLLWPESPCIIPLGRWHLHKCLSGGS